jgi:tetratricopeptide (TPR) repeat protein
MVNGGFGEPERFRQPGSLVEIYSMFNTQAIAAAYINSAQHLVRNNDYQAAEKLLNKAVKLDGRNSAAWEWIGCNHLFQGRYQEFIECIDRALELSPADSHLLKLQGQGKLMFGEWDAGWRGYEFRPSIQEKEADAKPTQAVNLRVARLN